MPRRLAASLLAGLLLAGSGAAASEAVREQRPRRPSALRPPGNPELAVRAELEEARRAGTRAAYDLFIRRHSNHPLAMVARKEREALPQRPG
jgi:hypothetical protein